MKTATEILQESASTYERKNADYGESWKLIGVILYLMAHGKPVVLETPQDYIAMGLFTRRLDKLCRSFHGEFVADEMNFESAADSDEDEAVYAAMSAENKHDRKYEDDLELLVREALSFLQTQDHDEAPSADVETYAD